MVAIGIDLGTTYSCVAVMRNNSVEVIPNELGNRNTPSLIAFKDYEIITGENVMNQVNIKQGNIVFDVKRIIGHSFESLSIQKNSLMWPFEVVDVNGKPMVQVEYKKEPRRFAPEQLSGILLSRLKRMAEEYLKEKVTGAVITVPAYFNAAQRAATRTAGVLGGFNVLRIINEPTAAALAYGMERNIKNKQNVMVYDLGGGTVDVSILTIGKGLYEVRATSGHSGLGGRDFDNRLFHRLKNYYEEEFKITIPPTNNKVLRKIRIKAEEAKRSLTSAKETTVFMESLLNDGVDYSVNITRESFEELCSDLFLDAMNPVHRTLDDANMTAKHIQKVVPIGGSTRIPKIRSMLQACLDGKDLTSSINPDEAVARGAAIQASILDNTEDEDLRNVLLVDVVSLSLGMETYDGKMRTVVKRNTVIPCSKTVEINTDYDYQNDFLIKVYEGERQFVKDNNYLATVNLRGIPQVPRGVAKIDLTFDIDADGIVKVSAKDQLTEKQAEVVINRENKLSQEDIAALIEEAEVLKVEDEEHKERIILRNRLEELVYHTRQAAIDKKHILTASESKLITTQSQEILTWIEENPDCSKDNYLSKVAELTLSWSSVLQKLNNDKFGHIFKRFKRAGAKSRRYDFSGMPVPSGISSSSRNHGSYTMPGTSGTPRSSRGWAFSGNQTYSGLRGPSRMTGPSPGESSFAMSDPVNMPDQTRVYGSSKMPDTSRNPSYSAMPDPSEKARISRECGPFDYSDTSIPSRGYGSSENQNYSEMPGPSGIPDPSKSHDSSGSSGSSKKPDLSKACDSLVNFDLPGAQSPKMPGSVSSSSPITPDSSILHESLATSNSSNICSSPGIFGPLSPYYSSSNIRALKKQSSPRNSGVRSSCDLPEMAGPPISSYESLDEMPGPARRKVSPQKPGRLCPYRSLATRNSSPTDDSSHTLSPPRLLGLPEMLTPPRWEGMAEMLNPDLDILYVYQLPAPISPLETSSSPETSSRYDNVYQLPAPISPLETSSSPETSSWHDLSLLSSSPRFSPPETHSLPIPGPSGVLDHVFASTYEPPMGIYYVEPPSSPEEVRQTVEVHVFSDIPVTESVSYVSQVSDLEGIYSSGAQGQSNYAYVPLGEAGPSRARGRILGSILESDED